MKRTAIELIIERIKETKGHEYVSMNTFMQWCEDALDYERNQIIDAFNEGALDGLQLGEQYYSYIYGNIETY